MVFLTRKSNCMSGWDRAPKLPDMGLFRRVYLIGMNEDRILDVLVRQKHENGTVELHFDVNTCKKAHGASSEYKVTVTAPDGKVFTEENSPETMLITEPMLWWPIGYGEQYLYTVKVEVLHDGQTEDVWEKRIGLRTMGMKIEKDEAGESFAHEVNGVAIFAMGADYIPEDCLLPNRSEAKTRLLSNSVPKQIIIA